MATNSFTGGLVSKCIFPTRNHQWSTNLGRKSLSTLPQTAKIQQLLGEAATKVHATITIISIIIPTFLLGSKPSGGSTANLPPISAAFQTYRGNHLAPAGTRWPRPHKPKPACWATRHSRQNTANESPSIGHAEALGHKPPPSKIDGRAQPFTLALLQRLATQATQLEPGPPAGQHHWLGSEGGLNTFYALSSLTRRQTIARAPSDGPDACN